MEAETFFRLLRGDLTGESGSRGNFTNEGNGEGI
jgi:hypothetical protein